MKESKDNLSMCYTLLLYLKKISCFNNSILKIMFVIGSENKPSQVKQSAVKLSFFHLFLVCFIFNGNKDCVMSVPRSLLH